MRLSITLARARAAGIYPGGYKPVAAYLGPGFSLDESFPLLVVLDHGRGLDDALWALQCTLPEQDDLKRRVVSLFLADVLERIEDKMTDERSRAVIPLLREHAESPVSEARWKGAWGEARAAEARAVWAEEEARAEAARAVWAEEEALEAAVAMRAPWEEAAWAKAEEEAAWAVRRAAARAEAARAEAAVWAEAAARAASAARAAEAGAVWAEAAEAGEAWAVTREAARAAKAARKWQAERLRYYLSHDSEDDGSEAEALGR